MRPPHDRSQSATPRRTRKETGRPTLATPTSIRPALARRSNLASSRAAAPLPAVSLPVSDKASSRLPAARFEQHQQRGRGRRPQCRSAAIAGDGRLDALADPRLASKRLADPGRSLTRLLMTKISRVELTMSRSLRALAIAHQAGARSDAGRPAFSRRRLALSLPRRSLVLPRVCACWASTDEDRHGRAARPTRYQRPAERPSGPMLWLVHQLLDPKPPGERCGQQHPASLIGRSSSHAVRT
jgi:hypothetical protein